MNHLKTKHYGAERLASKIGVGTLDNSWAKGYYQAGGLDYAKRYADAYADFKKIAKEKALPPGPPNLKFIYAQEELARERAKSELVADLTIMNSISLKQWEQINKDKDPGPPVCLEPTCNGSGIGVVSPTLPENEIYFYHNDHLGSTSYITNIQGETVQFNSYLPFGEDFVLQQRTTTISDFTFLSKEKDRESSNHYLSARYYNSQLSLFLTIDPKFEETGEPYGYGYRNPIRYIDPTGLKGEDIYELDAEGKLHNRGASDRDEVYKSSEFEGEGTDRKLKNDHGSGVDIGEKGSIEKMKGSLNGYDYLNFGTDQNKALEYFKYAAESSVNEFNVVTENMLKLGVGGYGLEPRSIVGTSYGVKSVSTDIIQHPNNVTLLGHSHPDNITNPSGFEWSGAAPSKFNNYSVSSGKIGLFGLSNRSDVGVARNLPNASNFLYIPRANDGPMTVNYTSKKILSAKPGFSP